MYQIHSNIGKIPYTDTSWYLYLQKDESRFDNATLGIENVNMCVLQVNNANIHPLD